MDIGKLQSGFDKGEVKDFGINETLIFLKLKIIKV